MKKAIIRQSPMLGNDPPKSPVPKRTSDLSTDQSSWTLLIWLLGSFVIGAPVVAFLIYDLISDTLAKHGEPSLPVSLGLPTFAMAQFITFMSLVLWHVNAAKRLPHYGAEGLKFTTLLVTLGYLIPVANCIVPVLAMRELGKASRDPGNWKSVSSLKLVDLWGVTHCLWCSSVMAMAIVLASTGGQRPESELPVLAGSTLLGLLHNAMTFYLVRVIVALQLVASVAHDANVKSPYPRNPD